MSIQFEEVYERYKTDLIRFLISLSGEKEVAEDILHDTFAKLISLDQEGRVYDKNLKSLLFKTSYNLYLNYRRKNSRQSREREDFFESISNESKSEKDEKFLNKIYSFLRKCLDTKMQNERQKTAVTLRLINQLDANEIAKILGVSRRTVYRDLEAGLLDIKKEFIKEGIFISGEIN